MVGPNIGSIAKRHIHIGEAVNLNNFGRAQRYTEDRCCEIRGYTYGKAGHNPTNWNHDTLTRRARFLSIQTLNLQTSRQGTASYISTTRSVTHGRGEIGVATSSIPLLCKQSEANKGGEGGQSGTESRVEQLARRE